MFDRMNPSTITSARSIRVWPILLVAIVFAGLPRALVLPLSAIHLDENIYALVARDAAHGVMPLDGAFDHKPVLIYYLYALPQLLFGETPQAIRTLSIAVGIAAATLFGLFCREAISRDRTVVFTATVAFACLSTLSRGLATHPELVMIMLLVAVWLLMTRIPDRGPPPVGVLLGIGGLWGAAFQVNYLTAFLLLAFCLDYLVVRLCAAPVPRALRDYLLHGAIVFAGFMASIVALLVPILIWGDVGGYFAAQLGYLSEYGIDRSLGRVLADLPKVSRDYAVLSAAVLAALAVGVRALLSRRSWPGDPETAILVGRMLIYVAICTWAIVLNGRTHEKYVLLLLPSALAILMAALAQLPDRNDAKLFFCAWLVLFCVISLEKERVLLKQGAEGYLNILRGAPTDTLDEIARYIRRDLSPGDTIYVHDYPSMLYLSAGVAPPTRFPWSLHHLDESLARAVGISRKEEMNAILDSRPAFVVAGSDPEEGRFGISSRILSQRLRSDYTLAATFQDDVFRQTVSAFGENVPVGGRDGQVRVYRRVD